MPMKKILLLLLALSLSPLAGMAAGEGRSLPLLVGLRTNMLYDAILIPNVGAEVAIGDRWAVGLDVRGAWWSGTHHHRSWRIFGCDVTGRYYLSPRDGRRLTGHHVGLYAQISTYDFKFGTTGYIGGVASRGVFNHPTVGVGAEYGYTLDVSRRVAFDFSIGVGWSGGHNEEYRTEGGHDVWQRTLNRNWFGPTRAAVSFVYYLARD